MPPRPGYTWHHRRPEIREAVRSGHTTVNEIAAAIGQHPGSVYHMLVRMRRDGLATQHKPHGERAARWHVR